MAKGFTPAPESPQRQAQPKERKLAVDAEQVQAQWLSHFQTLADPRGKQGQEHAFLSIVFIAILAVVGGATGWEDIELYAESHQEWLGSFLELRNGVPRADTYRRVFERLSPEALQQCFLGWVAQVVEQTGGQVIPIDGKSMKGSYDRSQKHSALHMVSAKASSHRLMLGLVLVENKTNEIKAIKSVTGITGDYGVHHHYRCHGHPNGDCSADCGQRSRLRFVSQGQPSHVMRTGESLV